MSRDKGIFFLISNFKILLILLHSKLSLTAFDPGLVDSPPISINFAPAFNKWIACLTPFFSLLNFPPSEKLSGVKFSTPNMFGNSLKSRFEKLLFFDLIFFKSKFIFFFE